MVFCELSTSGNKWYILFEDTKIFFDFNLGLVLMFQPIYKTLSPGPYRESWPNFQVKAMKMEMIYKRFITFL